ncbi:unnamed protein product [Darwinula stevensoni]|uniref:Kringle domain-containing protein n=1 Tax=Darwinula stevensoni TaxID=69355 RepID=A0A7R9ACP7_9CRUS|nr:unnamed protein product [Darwinula stevensoni]CAG0900576.1 unnamed protein product [Darwinula stevensoni]
MTFHTSLVVLCLTPYPSIENAEEAFEGGTGENPIQPGGKVTFTCKHPRGFSDGSKTHEAACSLAEPDAWCTTFVKEETALLCPPPRKHVSKTKREKEEVGKVMYPDCLLTVKGKEYMGRVNVTETGKSCLRWDAPELRKIYDADPIYKFDAYPGLLYEEFFLNLNPASHENFCRNPTTKDRPWCFVDDDGEIHSEYCRIPLCDDKRAPECKLTQKGGEYMGVKNITISGFPCNSWLDPKNQEYERIQENKRLTFSDPLTTTHNYCRNPNGSPGGPWCSIKDTGGSGMQYEYCDVPFCALEAVEREYGDEAPRMYPECRMTEMGKEYIGSENQTESGRNCLFWREFRKIDLNFISSHLSIEDRYTGSSELTKIFRHVLEMQDGNFCRNLALKERPWCFVSYDFSWEYCNIPLCRGSRVPLECKITHDGTEYAGSINVTAEGEKCIPWLAMTPNRNSALQYLLWFPDFGLDSRHNYCRNIHKIYDGPWCKTKQNMISSCKIPFCSEEDKKPTSEEKSATGNLECRQTETGTEYVGTMRKTETRKNCLRWDSQPYGKLDDFNPALTYEEHFQRNDPSTEENFCRNPTSKERPWCFVDDAEKKWEFCDIPLCSNHP